MRVIVPQSDLNESWKSSQSNCRVSYYFYFYSEVYRWLPISEATAFQQGWNHSHNILISHHQSHQPSNMKNECQSNSRSVWEFTGCTERDPTGEFTGCTERVVPMDMDPICTRSQPEPLRHNDPRAGLDELLEEWPRHMSDCLANSQDWLSMHKTLRQRVTISERSTMQLYHLSPTPRMTASAFLWILWWRL